MADTSCGFGDLVGNEELQARLATELSSGKLSHAYLLEGKHGSGRRTLALGLCAALACRARGTGEHLPCGHCPACEKILSGKSPDIRRVTRAGKATIGVDDVRFLRSDVLVEPNDLENKIYIVEDADTMTPQAQNALLLTLEEPPSYVLFLLLCEDASRLLETVRSRVQPLRLRAVERDAMRAYLGKNAPAFRALSPAEAEELLQLADGSIGRALELLDPKERTPILERRRLAAAFAEAKLGGGGAGALLALTDRFGTKREEIVKLLEEAQLALRDLLVLKKADSAPLCFYTDREAALSIACRTPAGTITALSGKLGDAREQLLRNGNVRLILTSLAL